MAGEMRVIAMTANQLELYKALSTQVNAYLQQGAPATDIMVVLQLAQLSLVEIAGKFLMEESKKRVEVAPATMKVLRN